MIVKFLKSQKNLILYAIIGGLSAGFDFCVYAFLTHVSVNYMIANVFSVHFGIITSFILNRYFNFKVKDKVFKRFLSFYVIGLLGLAISTGILYILVTMNSVDEVISKLITIIVVSLMQFIFNKLITFKN